MIGFYYHTNNPFIVLLILAILIALYFLPTLIAAARQKLAPRPVILVNILLGWTVIGWLVALVLAFTGETR